jgi:leucyl aminopeptidase
MLNTNIISVANSNETENLIILSRKDSLSWASKYLSTVEISVLEKQVKDEAAFVMLNSAARWVIVEFVSDKNDVSVRTELMRRNAGSRVSLLRTTKIDSVTLLNEASENLGAAYVEGLVLGNYKFIKYFKQADKQTSFFKTLKVIENTVSAKELEELKTLLETVCIVRDLVNEPVITLDAVQLAKEIADLGKEAGFSSETFDKNKIEELGMGGLLSVNMGSQIPPTFNIMEWKPESAKNSKAIVLVGKGVVYDTGGLSLKPTPNSMDFMKCDMAGAVAVLGSMQLIADLKLPYRVIAIVPACENSVDAHSFMPSDVIQSYAGHSIEIIDTDAEGRLILADGLSYLIKNYKPETVIDLATLTGSAVGTFGYECAALFTNNEDLSKKLQQSGDAIGERLWQLPLWDAYKSDIESEIADVKNYSGKPVAGAISAAKFLEFFTDEHQSWAHLDIAGVAFGDDEFAKTKHATGYGVHLITKFIENL